MTSRAIAPGDERALEDLQPGAHIHLVGIGGIGLSAIARVLLQRGYVVSGSDLSLSPITQELVALGAEVHEGHRGENVAGAEAVIVSSAVPEDNPEIIFAGEQGIPVLKRGQALSWLMKDRYSIAVAGTHGKTTVSAMIGLLLENDNRDPTIIVGGIIPELGANAKEGKGEYLVVEADEYDRAFLHFSPRAAVVTNIEMDHPDCFVDVEDVSKAFREFLSKMPTGGFLLACVDNPQVREIVEDLSHLELATYGLGSEAHWRATHLEHNAEGETDFLVTAGDEQKGRFQLSIPGTHNVANALAAIGIADHLGLDLSSVRDTLKHFHGVGRRFEVRGESEGITVVDDYAHHPSEVKATLAAARQRYDGRRIWVVFQPHTYSRTKALLNEFAGAFGDADRVVVTAIYPAREQDTLGMSAGDLVERMDHPHSTHVADLDEAATAVASELTSGDVLFTMGAGDVWRVGERVLAILREKKGRGDQ
jgi:UDP-N-acetylmuramate--alanine ligase